MNNKDDDKGTYKILFKYLRNDKLKLFLYVVFALLSYLPSLFVAIITGLGLEALILKKFKKFVIYLFLATGLQIFSYSIAQVIKDYIHNYLEIKFIKNVSKDIYHKYQNMPAIAFEEMGVGELINRLSSDTDRVMELLARIIKMACKLAIVVFVIIISFGVSIYIGLEILIFGLIMGIISYKFFPIIKNTQKLVKTQTDKLIKSTTENVTGIREIKALGIKSNIEKSVNKRIDALSSNNMKIRNYEMGYFAINNLIYYLLEFIILLTCGYLFVKGHIAYSIFMMLENYIWRIDEAVSSISEFGVDYNKVKVSLYRIDQIVNNKLYQDEEYGTVNLKNAQGVITFENVSFKYRDNEKLALNNLNLTLEPNKKIAIVGRSGNGKSTIFNLLLRYFDATEGKILIDGVNIKDLTEKSLRSTISSIRQNPFLFNMSVIDNFRLVKPKVTLQEVREVCQKAYIDDYIMSLPDKYDSIIGEGGINLSGGQKQRLAIARTLLLNTKIILFDEATSALDNESQGYIKKTIDNLVKNHTIIIIAHRLSTIVDADEIYLIDKGTLAAQGKHKELLKKSNIYRNLYLNEDINGDE